MSNPRTDRVKIRNVETGLVIERQAPDASALTDRGYVFATADEPSIREILQAKSRAELETLAEQIGQNTIREKTDHLVSVLIPHVENGTITL